MTGLAVLAAFTGMSGAEAAPANRNTRVNVAPDGSQANPGGIPIPDLSPDARYVAFHTRSSNLVAGDTNAVDDVFVRDLTRGVTERASVATTGEQGNGGSFFPVINADGRFVAFGSGADNLVPNDTNAVFSPTTTLQVTGRDVFVRDRQTGVTERVSVSSASESAPEGEQGNCGNLDSGQPRPCSGGIALADPAISADGRYVAFTGNATNLVPGDTNNAADVFVRDRQAKTTVRVSTTHDGKQPSAPTGTSPSSQNPSISADGRYIAFLSVASNLVPGDTNGGPDVFVRDMVGGTIERVSVAHDGQEATGGASSFNAARGISRPAISADGRYVAFTSDHTNLVPGDTNGSFDIFVRDRVAATTRRVSVATGGGQADNASFFPAISGNGGLVTFDSLATNLVPGDTNDVSDVFAHDLATGATQRISVGSGGVQGDAGSFFPAVNGDGRFVAYSSEAENLVPRDTNAAADVFLHDRTPPAVPARGYRLVASDGGIFSFGRAPFYGSLGGARLNSTIVGMAPTASGRGYWMAAANGEVFGFGDAPVFGWSGVGTLNKPIVAIAGTPTAKGYWLVASDGGVFAFGDARFFGSTGGITLNRPIVGMAGTPTGLGYWLVATDGGIFAFGDAAFRGSTGGIRLNLPIVAMAPTSTGDGYWLVASDGGVFAFNADFLGSTGHIRLNKPVVGMAETSTGRGYWLVASDGGIFAFGDAQFFGSTGSIRLNRPIVGMSVF